MQPSGLALHANVSERLGIALIIRFAIIRLFFYIQYKIAFRYKDWSIRKK